MIFRCYIKCVFLLCVQLMTNSSKIHIKNAIIGFQGMKYCSFSCRMNHNSTNGNIEKNTVLNSTYWDALNGKKLSFSIQKIKALSTNSNIDTHGNALPSQGSKCPPQHPFTPISRVGKIANLEWLRTCEKKLRQTVTWLCHPFIFNLDMTIPSSILRIIWPKRNFCTVSGTVSHRHFCSPQKWTYIANVCENAWLYMHKYAESLPIPLCP